MRLIDPRMVRADKCIRVYTEGGMVTHKQTLSGGIDERREHPRAHSGAVPDLGDTASAGRTLHASQEPFFSADGLLGPDNTCLSLAHVLRWPAVNVRRSRRDGREYPAAVGRS
jgi:hypothetical protein